MKKTIRIVIAGAGTVGESTIKLLFSKNVKDFLKDYNVELVKVLVKNINKKRENLLLQENTIITSEKKGFLEGIDVFVELIGGTTDAKDLFFEALEKGISVVTANKALIALDINTLREKIEKNNCSFGMEAAVGGGIPIIRTLTKSYSQDSIEEISGILNGTCNFILTKMIPSKMGGEGESYEDAFKKAKNLGYPEQDIPGELNPDLDGPDTRSKLAILGNLSFGAIINEENIFMQGIRDISSIDFEISAKLDSNIKFVGIIKKENNTLYYYVSPTIVANSNEISKTNGVTNIINIVSENIGSQAYKGPGAGGLATANSVVADIIDIIKGGTTELRCKIGNLTYNNNFKSCFYIRYKIGSESDILEFKNKLEKLNIKVDKNIEFEEIKDYFIFTTKETEINIIKKLKNEKLLFLPILK